MPRALWLLPLWLTVVTIIVIFFGAFILLVNARIKRQAKKQFKAAQTSGPTTYTFSDDGLHTQSQLNNSNTSWQSFEKAEETSEFMFLKFPNNFSLFMPRQRFADGQWDILRSLIRSKLGAAAKLL